MKFVLIDVMCKDYLNWLSGCPVKRIFTFLALKFLDKKGKVRLHKDFDFIAYDVTCVGGKIGFRIFSDFYDPLDSHYLRKS